METVIALAIIIVFMTVLFLIIGTIITAVDKTKTTVGKIFNSEERKINKLTEELKIIHYQLLLTSERFRNCNSDFIQELNKTFAKGMMKNAIEKAQKEGEKDIDQTIKFYEENFKAFLIDNCIEKIEDEPDLDEYINYLEQECEEARLFVQKALNKYDNGVSSFWEQLAEHADNDYFHEVSYMFYLEHYALTQGFMLDAWKKDKKGDNSYLYPEQKTNY